MSYKIMRWKNNVGNILLSNHVGEDFNSVYISLLVAENTTPHNNHIVDANNDKYFSDGGGSGFEKHPSMYNLLSLHNMTGVVQKATESYCKSSPHIRNMKRILKQRKAT